MTVFKAFLKVLKKNIGLVIMYTVILVIFGFFSFTTNENNLAFEASKPDIAIVNYDVGNKFTDSFIDYLDKNASIQEPKDIDDALFYRDISYVVYIPKNYGEDFMNGISHELETKSNKVYNSELARMLVEKYLKTASTYRLMGMSEEEVITKTSETLKNDVSIKVTSKLDTTSLQKATTFYNFVNYSMLSGCILIVTLILFSFKEDGVRKRTIVSGMDYRKYDRILFWSNSLFVVVLWAIYMVLSIILVRDVIFSSHGIIYIVNSLLLSMCALSIAVLISNLVSKKEAINGIVNVVGLGSSFLCGAFVPMEWLPNSVLTIAHILPSYWFIKTNETVRTIEEFTAESILPIIINMFVLVGFTFLFFIISSVVSRKKRKM